MTLNSGHKKWLETNMGDSVTFGTSLASLTSFGTGGPADAVITPPTRDVLRKVVLWARHSGLKIFTLGKGTNLLFSDQGFPGIILKLTDMNDDIISETFNNRIILTVAAGMKLQDLCLHAVKEGNSGLIFATGIPGTVGGGIFMNAGTSSGSFEDILQSLEVMLPDGQILNIDKTDMLFSYRKFGIHNRVTEVDTQHMIFLSCGVKLGFENGSALKESYDRYNNMRKSKHPLDKKNAGSFFKNPIGEKTAGELIEQAGLKGTKVGDAEVSEKHANFLVNNGNATTADLLNLMEIVQKKVKEVYHITLTPEVRIIG